MNLSNDGLSLWYGTPDAPAPGDAGSVPRRGASLVVGVQPPNPTNRLTVRYRVDGGREETVAGRELRTDYERNAQYFAVNFPEFVTGKVVEYLPVFGSVGRQVPAPNVGTHFPSKFQLGPSIERLPPPTPPRAAVERAPSVYRYAADTSFVAAVAVDFESPQYVGDTAAGVRVNFFVREGNVTGDGFRGTVLQGASDQMLVRPDGMGVVHIAAAFATADGARLDVEAGGYVDFGVDGYRRALAQDLPDRAAIALTPLISTRHPRYRWLSRIQCIGVGFTHLDANQASYYIYAAASRAR